MVNIRKKGSEAELELCRRLQPFFSSDLKRNLEQVRSGGSDIDGCYPFIIEVKRVEKVDLGNKNKWWKQIIQARCGPEDIPVVAFRPSKQAWRFLLSAEFIVKGQPGWVEVSEEIFLSLICEELSL